MNKKTIEKFEECIKKYEKANDGGVAGLYDALDMARMGDANVEPFLIEVIKSFEMTDYESAFSRFIHDCDQKHLGYQDRLDELKRVYWGKPLLFARALEQINREYESVYRSARKNRVEFEKCQNEFVKANKKVKAFLAKFDDEQEIEGECKQPNATLPELLAGVDRPLTPEEAGILDKYEVERAIKYMDDRLHYVRTNMYNDFQLGKLATDAINDTAKQEAQAAQQERN